LHAARATAGDIPVEQLSAYPSLFDTTHVGKWYCIEAHTRLNDPGRSDGRYFDNFVVSTQRIGC
jgi:hypothetical protein